MKLEDLKVGQTIHMLYSNHILGTTHHTIISKKVVKITPKGFARLDDKTLITRDNQVSDYEPTIKKEWLRAIELTKISENIGIQILYFRPHQSKDLESLKEIHRLLEKLLKAQKTEV